MAGELEKLLSDAGLPQEQIEATLKAFDPKGLEATEKGILRQSDYSRRQDELARERQTLQDRWKAANDEYQRMQTDYQSTVAEKEEAARKLEEAEKKLKEAPQIDPAKFVSRDDVTKQFQDFAFNSAAYLADVLEIAGEHQDLFGKRVSAQELLQKSVEAKKTPREYWMETYKVQDARDERTKKAQEERDNAIRREEREKVIAEVSKPPAARDFDPSRSPFYIPKEEKSSPWDDSGPTEAETNLLKELTSIGRV